MAKPEYKVLYNQDCTDLFCHIKEPLEPRHVDLMVDEVADGGADVMLINPNAQRVCYPSTVWQTFWDGYAPGKREFFGPIPDADVPGREHWVSQMKRLPDQGCDYLAHALARCRHKGIAPGITVRMNDMHDVPWPGANLFSRFYMEHPDLHLHNPPVSGWSATGLNYEHDAVRQHYLALIRELVTAYDFDVLELDFLRFHCYFPRADFARHAGIMTGFVREVRSLIRASGRRLALIPRVAVTPASAYELGFDVAAWAKEGLIDGITAGAFLNTSWHTAVDEFRALLGPRIAIYACTDHAADRRDGVEERALPLDARLLRGFAAGHRAAGADGVAIFNFFCAREATPPVDPLFGVLREMRSLDGLRGKPKTYTLSSGWAIPEVDGPMQVPAAVPTGQPRRFNLFLCAEPPNARVEVELLIETSDPVAADTLWLHLNHLSAGPAFKLSEPSPAPGKTEPPRVRQTAIFAVPSAALRDGLNVLTVRNEGAQITALSLDVRVDVGQ